MPNDPTSPHALLSSFYSPNAVMRPRSADVVLADHRHGTVGLERRDPDVLD